MKERQQYTVLFVNCCPHTAVEEKFWNSVNEELAKQGVDFVVHHNGMPLTSLPTLTGSTRVSAPSHFEGLEGEYFDRMRAWNRACDKHAYISDVVDMQDTLFVVRPDLVVVWNGEQPRDVILKRLLKTANCKLLVLERTPWPGMISADEHGVLSDCSFWSQEIRWESDNAKYFWKDVFKRYENEVRDSKRTWWHQPSCGEAQSLNQRARPLVLFAGQVDADTQNFLFSPHFKSNVDAFDWFVNTVAGEKVWVMGKHHPMSEQSVRSYVERIEGQNAEWRNDMSIEYAIDAAACVVAVNSSVLCEALIRRKPAFALGRTPLSISGAIDELQDPTDSSRLVQWLRSVLEQNLPLSDERSLAWEEFCAFHFSRHLFAMAATPDLENQRGAKQLSDAIAGKLKSAPKPTWQKLFSSSFTADFAATVAGWRRENCQLTNQLQSLKSERRDKPVSFAERLFGRIRRSWRW